MFGPSLPGIERFLFYFLTNFLFLKCFLDGAMNNPEMLPSDTPEMENNLNNPSENLADTGNKSRKTKYTSRSSKNSDLYFEEEFEYSD